MAENTSIDITFWGRSYYAGNDCDFWVYEVSLETVSKDYGGIVDVIGTPSTITTTEKIAVSDVEAVLTTPSGKTLGDVVAPDEIDLIAEGLRSLAANAPDTKSAAGLHKLAEVLERLR